VQLLVTCSDLPLCVTQESNIGFWLRRRRICKYFCMMQSIVVDNWWFW